MCALNPLDELGAPDFRALVVRLDLALLAIDKLPLLLLDRHEPLLELVPTQDDRKWYFVLLSRRELRRELRLRLEKEVRL